jgi:DNA-binding transcriptional MocR family regulator
MLWMTLDGKGPLYLQMYRAIRKAILGGKLAPGARLPSTRTLADELGVSRNMVILAYEQLQAEGYLAPRRASGTFVAAELPDEITSVARSGPPVVRHARATPERLSTHVQRMLAAVGPRGIVWGFRRRALPYDEQFVLAEFIRDGHFERHLRRSRARNAARRAATIEAVGRYLGDRVEVAGANAGLHVLLWLREMGASQIGVLRKKAAAVGVGVYSTVPYYLMPPRQAGLLLGYTSLTEDQIREGIQRLASVFR